MIALRMKGSWKPAMAPKHLSPKPSCHVGSKLAALRVSPSIPRPSKSLRPQALSRLSLETFFATSEGVDQALPPHEKSTPARDVPRCAECRARGVGAGRRVRAPKGFRV